jgi:hypothetical protein
VSNREALQPRLEQQPGLQDRAVGAHARASGCSTTFAPIAGKQRRGQSACAQRCSQGGQLTREQSASGEPGPSEAGRKAKRAARSSPLDPAKPIFVHPEVQDGDGHHTLRLPQPSAPRDMPSFRRSGELACRLGCYLPTAAKGKTNVYAKQVWVDLCIHIGERCLEVARGLELLASQVNLNIAA